MNNLNNLLALGEQAERRSKLEERRETYRAYAASMWLKMDKNEKTGIRFGMFPAAKMRAAEADGFEGKDLCVALMDVASKNGGMVA